MKKQIDLFDVTIRAYDVAEVSIVVRYSRYIYVISYIRKEE